MSQSFRNPQPPQSWARTSHVDRVWFESGMQLSFLNLLASSTHLIVDSTIILSTTSLKLSLLLRKKCSTVPDLDDLKIIADNFRYLDLKGTQHRSAYNGQIRQKCSVDSEAWLCEHNCVLLNITKISFSVSYFNSYSVITSKETSLFWILNCIYAFLNREKVRGFHMAGSRLLQAII